MLRISKSGWLLIKVTLMLLSVFFIFLHIKQQGIEKELNMLAADSAQNSGERIYILFVVLLMLFNWFLEAVKWHYLTSFFYQQSISEAARAVLTGLAFSIFTPNRSGDFAGRIMHLPPDLRIEGAVFSFVGSFTQVLVTITAGCLSAIYLSYHLSVFSNLYFSVLIPVFIFSLLCLHYVAINLRKYWPWIVGIKWLKALTAKVHDVEKLKPQFLIKIITLSWLRYVVFTLQFYLLLRAFEVNLSIDLMISLVMITFFFITLIPSFTLSEIGIRGSVCVYLFSRFMQDTSGVLLASSLLWLINIGIPAFIGAIGILSFKRIK